MICYICETCIILFLSLKFQPYSGKINVALILSLNNELQGKLLVSAL